MRAVVTGAIATYPIGGVAWDYGQYALGLERLGFEVYYLEDCGGWVYDPPTLEFTDDCTGALGFLARSLADLSPSLADRWHFRGSDGRGHGIDATDMSEIVSTADLFLNVSGMCVLRDEYMGCPRKVLIDTDPGWNQFVEYPRWDRETLPSGVHSFRAHDHFFTYAQRLGRPGCPIPNLGIRWHPTRPPVVIDAWSPGRSTELWTTVMSWNSQGESAEYSGVEYVGAKDGEFRAIERLPAAVSARFELAVAHLREKEADRLRGLGWSPIDGIGISGSIRDYRSYIQDSRGEFSVAKQVYVATRSGWFSCRSVCYLAASRPVVLQDTGFSEDIPTGQGLLCFSNLEEAMAAITAVERDYERHSAAARRIARRYFASDVVLGELLAEVACDAPASTRVNDRGEETSSIETSMHR